MRDQKLIVAKSNKKIILEKKGLQFKYSSEQFSMESMAYKEEEEKSFIFLMGAWFASNYHNTDVNSLTIF